MKRKARRRRKNRILIFLATLGFALLLVTVVNTIRLSRGQRGDGDGTGDIPAVTKEPDGGRPGPTAGPATGTVTAAPTGTPTPTPTPRPLLYINEILPTNTKYDKHNNGYYDAIELYNASEETIQLSDYCLSDSKKKLTKYPLPEMELPAGGYAVVYCTGEYEAKEETDLRFKLSYFGEKVYLADRDANILDVIEYPELPQNVSYGRDGAEFKVFDKPTLGAANEGGLTRMSVMPEVDVAPGFYEGAQSVSFVTAGTIRYTLDGSKPTSSSKVWDGKPITISSNCSLRAYAQEEGCLASFTSTFDYFIDMPEYTLDVMRLTVKKADLDKMNENYTSNTKYAANISMFTNGRLEFSEDCAVSCFGGSSRAYIKKSYQLTFSTSYGASKLRYRIFENTDTEEYNSIVLRSGGQDNEASLMKDEYISSLATDAGLIDDILVQYYRPVNLYVNDDYWGVYYVREHVDEDMVASHYGCDPEEVTVVKQMHSVKCGTDGKEWTDFWKFISNNRIKDKETYEYVKSIVDVQSVADYYIIQLWNGNIDMDNVGVCKAGDKFDGKWIFILYDLDLTLCREVAGTTDRMIGTFNAGYYTFNALVYRLLENDEFRELFCERMAYIMNNVLTDERCLAYIDGIADRIDHDMVYNCARWHPVKDPIKKTNYRSYDGWKSSVQKLREMVTGRGPKIIKDFIKAKGISSELVAKYFPDIT